MFGLLLFDHSEIAALRLQAGLACVGSGNLTRDGAAIGFSLAVSNGQRHLLRRHQVKVVGRIDEAAHRTDVGSRRLLEEFRDLLKAHESLLDDGLLRGQRFRLEMQRRSICGGLSLEEDVLAFIERERQVLILKKLRRSQRGKLVIDRCKLGTLGFVVEH